MRLSPCTTSIGLPVIALALLAVPVAAQRPAPQSATATMHVVAVVPAVLEFTTLTVTDARQGATHSIVTSAVAVRANVPHWVVVRAADTEPSGTPAEVRDQDGGWVALSADRWITVARSTALGHSTYAVECRIGRDPVRNSRSGEPCRLEYELRSQGVSSQIGLMTGSLMPTRGSRAATTISVLPTT